VKTWIEEEDDSDARVVRFKIARSAHYVRDNFTFGITRVCAQDGPTVGSKADGMNFVCQRQEHGKTCLS
jgi:hypothetical protein